MNGLKRAQPTKQRGFRFKNVRNVFGVHKKMDESEEHEISEDGDGVNTVNQSGAVFHPTKSHRQIFFQLRQNNFSAHLKWGTCRVAVKSIEVGAFTDRWWYSTVRPDHFHLSCEVPMSQQADGRHGFGGRGCICAPRRIGP